jgi:hypothetical protein
MSDVNPSRNCFPRSLQIWHLKPSSIVLSQTQPQRYEENQRQQIKKIETHGNR